MVSSMADMNTCIGKDDLPGRDVPSHAESRKRSTLLAKWNM